MDAAIGDRIKSARRAAGLTQEALSRRTELSLQAVGDIERGVVTDPHISSLRQIAGALRVPVSELLEEPEAVLAGAGKAKALTEEAGPVAAAELPGLKAARLRRGMSQNELAALSGLSASEIKDLEEGEPLAEAVPVEPLAAALNVALYELMFPAEQVAAFLSFDERDNERIRLEMEKLDANDLQALMLASPALRKLSEAFRKDLKDRGRPESEAC